MKIVCLECNRDLGEKFPFDDSTETHTLCRECLEQRLVETPGGLRGKFVKAVGRDT